MMAKKCNSTVYIRNLDERVNDRVLYDILIQAGRVVDLYVPRDKETDKPKGYAFADYESEEVAEYAVKLFSGLVKLYKRTLKFAISGQDKSVTVGSSIKPRPYSDAEASSLSSFRYSYQKMKFSQVSPDISMHRSGWYRPYHDSSDHNYDPKVFGAALDSIGRTRSGRHERHHSRNYNPSYY